MPFDNKAPVMTLSILRFLKWLGFLIDKAIRPGDVYGDFINTEIYQSRPSTTRHI